MVLAQVATTPLRASGTSENQSWINVRLYVPLLSFQAFEMRDVTDAAIRQLQTGRYRSGANGLRDLLLAAMVDGSPAYVGTAELGIRGGSDLLKRMKSLRTPKPAVPQPEPVEIRQASAANGLIVWLAALRSTYPCGSFGPLAAILRARRSPR
jgi:hypothetical protein